MPKATKMMTTPAGTRIRHLSSMPSQRPESKAAHEEDEVQHFLDEEVHIKQEEFSDDEGIAEDGDGGVAVEERDGNEVKQEEERMSTPRPHVLGNMSIDCGQEERVVEWRVVRLSGHQGVSEGCFTGNGRYLGNGVYD